MIQSTAFSQIPVLESPYAFVFPLHQHIWSRPWSLINKPLMTEAGVLEQWTCNCTHLHRIGSISLPNFVFCNFLSSHIWLNSWSNYQAFQKMRQVCANQEIHKRAEIAVSRAGIGNHWGGEAKARAGKSPDWCWTLWKCCQFRPLGGTLL